MLQFKLVWIKMFLRINIVQLHITNDAKYSHNDYAISFNGFHFFGIQSAILA